MEEQKKKRGGAREGAGRKRTSAKSIGLRVPEDVVAVLDRSGQRATDFIVQAIREKARRDGLI